MTKRWRLVVMVVAGLLIVPVLLGVAAYFMAGGELSDGFESGRLAGERWQIDADPDCAIAISEERAFDGRYALAFTAGADVRCEVVPKVYRGVVAQYRHEPFGEDRWYLFSTYLAEPWPPNETNEIIAQWHGTRDKLFGDVPSRGPPLAIRLYGDRFRITHGADPALVSTEKWLARYSLWNGPVVTGRWLRWRIQARWSHKDDGRLRIWLNGSLIVDHAGPNAYNDLRGVYLKLGPYHPDRRRRFFLDSVYIGDNPP